MLEDCRQLRQHRALLNCPKACVMRRSIPSTQALACFEAAARHESYTRAAQELALTQGAVSRQVMALEEFVGVELFRRTRHGVALTPAGEAYARKVRGWLLGMERDTLDLMAHQGSGGTIKLAAVPTFATRWLMPRLAQLARSQPEITVHIDVQTRPFLFADTGFDAALYAGTPEQVRNWPGIEALHLMDEDVVPVCSPALLDRTAQRAPGRAGEQAPRPGSRGHWPICRCCSKAPGRMAGSNGFSRWGWRPPAPWMAPGMSCFPCWLWPHPRAWEWH